MILQSGLETVCQCYPFPKCRKGVSTNVDKTIMTHPFGNGLYHLFMMIWGMVTNVSISRMLLLCKYRNETHHRPTNSEINLQQINESLDFALFKSKWFELVKGTFDL